MPLPSRRRLCDQQPPRDERDGETRAVRHPSPRRRRLRQAPNRHTRRNAASGDWCQRVHRISSRRTEPCIRGRCARWALPWLTASPFPRRTRDAGAYVLAGVLWERWTGLEFDVSLANLGRRWTRAPDRSAERQALGSLADVDEARPGLDAAKGLCGTRHASSFHANMRCSRFANRRQGAVCRCQLDAEVCSQP